MFTPAQAFALLRRRFPAVQVAPPSQVITTPGSPITVVVPQPSTGSVSDMLYRLKAVLPNGWFRGLTPYLDATLTGIAMVLSQMYALIAYAKLQTRITTATDAFLDLISFDYFGTALPRQAQEPDGTFRNRILSQLLLEKGTRAGLIKALTLLTGRKPWVFEPARPADTGGYNTGALAYNTAGGYGSLLLPYQAFVIAYRPVGQGIPNVAGYGIPTGAYNTASQIEYASLASIQGVVSDASIFATIDQVKPVATTIWTAIQS